MNAAALADFARTFARCRCCDETAECLEGCTFATDCPDDYDLMVQAREALKELPSEPVYGQWFDVREVPIPDDPDAWIVTVQTWTETVPGAEPRTVTIFSPYVDREHADAWLRITPPPWLAKEGK